MIGAMLPTARLCPAPQEVYVEAIFSMALHYRREPAGYSATEVQAYLFHLVVDRMPTNAPRLKKLRPTHQGGGQCGQ